MKLVKLRETIGAEITDINLANPLSSEELAEIKQAFLDYHVLAFRDQVLTPESQKVFGRHFGTFAIHPFRPAISGHPEVLKIAKEPEETQNVGGGWHTDMTFMPSPPLGSLLYAIELPPPGLGDTQFSDSIAAFEALSPMMQLFLRGLTALHTAERVHGVKATRNHNKFRQEAAQKPEATRVVEHPVVRLHPESGRLALFVNPAFTYRIKELSEEESRLLLDFLFQHMTKDSFVVRIQWQVGTLVLWDNRCTQHYALNDYQGHRREMHRLMIEGDRPVGISAVS